VSVRTLLRWEFGDTEPEPDHHRKYEELLRGWKNSVEKFL
jgi:hypothetical protein